MNMYSSVSLFGVNKHSFYDMDSDDVITKATEEMSLLCEGFTYDTNPNSTSTKGNIFDNS